MTGREALEGWTRPTLARALLGQSPRRRRTSTDSAYRPIGARRHAVEALDVQPCPTLGRQEDR